MSHAFQTSACRINKALLHVAAVMDEVSHMADLGVDYRARLRRVRGGQPSGSGRNL
uniref:hypothetical protein n=1 Tax=Limnohabitans sp. TaxID=1907725 RepID=UPI004047F918